jgi:hypothetical protein
VDGEHHAANRQQQVFSDRVFVMTKRKIPERARDCVTLAEKVAFSMMVEQEWQKMRENPAFAPSDIHDVIDKYDDPDCPWSQPFWAADWARAERAKREIMRTLGDD